MLTESFDPVPIGGVVREVTGFLFSLYVRAVATSAPRRLKDTALFCGP